MITKNLQIFGFVGADVTLATAAFKSQIRTLFRLNDAGTGWQSFSPASGFNAVTKLENGKFYFCDAASLPIDIPGAIVMAATATNLLPTASAGADAVITLPTNLINLVGSGTDTDGTITGYSWAQVTGPNVATLTNATSATATASGLVAGTYQFALTVTDNAGGQSTDAVLVTVEAALTDILVAGHSINTGYPSIVEGNLAQTDLVAPDFAFMLKNKLSPSVYGDMRCEAVPGQTVAQMLGRLLNGGPHYNGGPAFIGTTLPDRSGTSFGLVTLLSVLNSLDAIAGLRAQGNTAAADSLLAQVKLDFQQYLDVAAARNYRAVVLEEAAAAPAGYSAARNDLYDAEIASWNAYLPQFQHIYVLCRTRTDSAFATASATTNTTIYSDRTHFTVAGRQRVVDTFLVPGIAAAHAGQVGTVIYGDLGAPAGTNASFSATQLLYGDAQYTYAQYGEIDPETHGTGGGGRSGQPFVGAIESVHTPVGLYTGVTSVTFDCLRDSDCAMGVSLWAKPLGGSTYVKVSSVSPSLNGALDWTFSVTFPVNPVNTYSQFAVFDDVPTDTYARMYAFALHLAAN